MLTRDFVVLAAKKFKCPTCGNLLCFRSMIDAEERNLEVQEQIGCSATRMVSYCGVCRSYLYEEAESFRPLTKAEELDLRVKVPEMAATADRFDPARGVSGFIQQVVRKG